MALRKKKHPRDPGMSRFKAGLIALVVISVAVFFAFTKANPFASPYTLTAVFHSANNINGVGIKSIVGAIFVGIIMTPASMYMGLVIGSEIGQAAQWVTIILFMEVARRAFTTLKRPEIYILYYMAGASLVTGSGLLWNQFIVQSESSRQFGLTNKVPSWVAPSSMDA